MKYMIMECHPSYAVALDESGRFLRVANMRYEPGQTVTEVIPMQLPEKTQKTSRTWIRSLAAAAACFVLLLGAVFMMNRAPYASVYLSINPEVRVDVNRSDKVVGIEGVNQDGVNLIENYEYMKKDLDLVMDELVDLAIEKGYLHPGGAINLTLEATDETWVKNHENALPDQLNTYLTDKITVDIHVERASGKDGDSDYDDSDYGKIQTDPTGPVFDTNRTDYDANDGETDYGKTDYSKSDYGAVEVPAQAATEGENAATQDQKNGESPYDDDDNDDDDDDDTDYGDKD